MRSDLIQGVVLAVLGGAGILGAWQVPAAGGGDTWAGIMPFSAAAALVLLAGLMILGALRQPAMAGANGESEGPNATLEIIGLFLIALLYQQSMRWFGYVLPTAIVAPIVLYMFGVRSWIGLALSVILCPLIFHIIFFELLGAFPPFGMVFDLLDVLRG